MKILLIEAVTLRKGNRLDKENPKVFVYPAIVLPLLAAVTPPEFDVKIINDAFEEINYNEEADLVGMTFYTPSAFRAYEIADRFRKRGVKVVMGGVHASALPEEAAEHADSVVVGEGEEVWPKLLEDFKNGGLKKLYKTDGFVDMSKIPAARLDLLNRKFYITTGVIQASRGCSYGCEFCSIERIFGKKPRFRPIEEVIKEIKGMKKQRVILFSDDNLIMNPPYLKELCKALIPLKIHWMGEASWTIGKKPEILKLMKKSGCIGLLIGFESVREQKHTRKVSVYKDMRKAYKETVKNVHKYRMLVVGTFMFGFDNDDLSAFDETLKFCFDVDIDFAEFSLMMPFPETPLYKRLTEEGRMLSRDWSEYNYQYPGNIYKLKNMTTDEVSDNIRKMSLEYYSYRKMLPRFIRQLFRYRSIVLMLALVAVFAAYRSKAVFLNRRWLNK